MAATAKPLVLYRINHRGEVEPFAISSIALDHLFDGGIAHKAERATHPFHVSMFLKAAEHTRDMMIDDGYEGDAFDQWKVEEAPPSAPQTDRERMLSLIREGIQDAGPLRTSQHSDVQVLHLFTLLCDLIERTVP